MEIIIINTEETGDVFIETELDSLEVYDSIREALAEWRDDSDIEINGELIEAHLKRSFRGSGRKSRLVRFSGDILNL